MFEGKVAVVTGSAQGIGKAIVLQLQKLGCKVCCLDVQIEKNLHAFQEFKHNCFTYTCDVSQPKEVSATFLQIEKQFGHIDYLINNAAVFSTMSFAHTAWDVAIKDYVSNMNVNTFGTFLCTKMVVPFMIKQQGGVIINVITNHVKRELFSVSSSEHCYDASKYAQLSLTQSTAKELEKYGIRVYGVCPAATRTEMLESYFDPSERPVTLETMKKHVHNASLLEPEEVAYAVSGMLNWSHNEPVGKSYLLMYSKDCKELYQGHVNRLVCGSME